MSRAARPPAVRGPRKARPRATKIDWNDAFQAFAADPTLGYAGISRRYGVSEGAVRKHAKAEDWLERAGEVRARAADRATEHTVESFQRDAKKLVKDMLAKLQASIASGEEKPKSSDLAGIVKTGHLLYGEATDIVAITEVQALVAGLVRITAENVPAERRGEVLGQLEDFERTFGGLVAIEGGSQS